MNDFRLRAQPIRAPLDGCRNTTNRAQRALATGGGTKDSQESSIVDIGTKNIHVNNNITHPTHPTPPHPPTTTRDLDPDGVTSPSGELKLTGHPNDWS